jgi:L-rhamnose mutarotase
MKKIVRFLIAVAFITGSCVNESGRTHGSAPTSSTHSTNSTISTLPMKRICMSLDLRDDPEKIKQYKYVHTKEGIWPEIPRGIKEVGITDMEIYLIGTRMFMILEAPADWDFDTQMAKLGKLEKQPEWEEFVWQFQAPLPWAKPGEKWMIMEKVFDLDRDF